MDTQEVLRSCSPGGLNLWPRSPSSRRRRPRRRATCVSATSRACARKGIPAWSVEAEHCDGCGRILLAGEKPVLVRRGDGLSLACPLCAERFYDEGCLRVSVDRPGDTEEETQLPLAI